MEDKYINFVVKRMYIFNELVKRYWSGNLNTAADLNELAESIKTKYNFDDTDMPFITVSYTHLTLPTKRIV